MLQTVTVTNLTGGINIGVSLTDKIKEFYKTHRGTPYHISLVAEEINEKEITVKVIANRLWKRKDIEKVAPNTYQVLVDETKVVVKEEVDKNIIGFHGVRMLADRKKVTIKGESPTKVTGVTLGNKLLLPASPSEIMSKHISLDHFCKTAIGPKATQTYYFGREQDKSKKRKITVEVSQNVIEVTLKNSDENLTVPEFDIFLTLLELIFYPYFYDYNWKVQTFGIAIDFYDLTIEGSGITQLTLQDLRGYIKRWYEKKGIKALRRETHTRKGVPLEELIQNLRGDTPLGTVELIELVQRQAQALEQLNKQYQEVRVKLNKLLEQISILNSDVAKEPMVLTF